MSGEKSPSKDGFVQSVLSFFKKISLKAKLIMGMILGFAAGSYSIGYFNSLMGFCLGGGLFYLMAIL